MHNNSSALIGLTGEKTEWGSGPGLASLGTVGGVSTE